MSWPPPRILLAAIHLGWELYAPPGRTLSPNEWPKTTQKLTRQPRNESHPHKSLRPWAVWQSSPAELLYPSVLCPGNPLLIKSRALSSPVSPRTTYLWVLGKSPLLGPKVFSLLATADLQLCFSGSLANWVLPGGSVGGKVRAGVGGGKVAPALRLWACSWTPLALPPALVPPARGMVVSSCSC